MRCFFIILDGLGDRGYEIFNGKTPLYAASSPNLDYIAKQGATGLYHPYKVGISLPSELAHFLMFGYNIDEFPGRGILEALGNDIEIKKDHVVLMGRLLGVERVDGKLIVKNEKPHISNKDLKKIIDAIKYIKVDEIEFKLYPIKGSFCLIVLSNASRYVTDSNPILKNYPLFKVKPLKGHCDNITKKTANAINRYLISVHKILSHLYNKRIIDVFVNAIATQRAGALKELESFQDRWGLKAISISSSDIFKGLGKLINMDYEIVEDKDAGIDLLRKIELAYNMKDYDFIHIHTKAPDEAAHTKDSLNKKKIIEILDRAFEFVIEKILPQDRDLVVITADHSTPSCGNMIHSGEPVPIIFAGKGVRVDDVEYFNEISCASGSLNLLRGHELMYMIINLMDRGRLLGLSDCDDPPFYFPGKYEPLNITEYGYDA